MQACAPGKDAEPLPLPLPPGHRLHVPGPLRLRVDQRGLRPAATGSKPDLLVQTYLIVANRQEQIVTTDGYGGPWGGPWGYAGGPWEGYWGAPMYNETRNVVYQVGTLQIDLIDAKDG